MKKTKSTKQFDVQRAEAPRKCVNCERAIKTDTVCLHFTFVQKKEFVVTANLCNKCLGRMISKVINDKK